MKTLVTGAAGFIGSHLVNRLIEDGHFVLALDRYRKGKEDIFKQFNKKGQLRILKANFEDQKQLRDSFFKGVDWLFHLGALVNRPESQIIPLKYHRTNVTGTFNILQKAKKNRVKKIIYASTDSIYGISKIVPTPEEAPINCDSVYALTKYMAEQLVLHFGKVYKLPCLILRMSGVYGPAIYGNTYGSILTLFMRQRLEGRPYTVIGDGSQRRDLVYVSDVVEAFIKAIQSNYSGEIFNVGSGANHSIREIVTRLGGKVTYLPARIWEGKIKLNDISKIKKMLKWEPKIDLSEGIKRILS